MIVGVCGFIGSGKDSVADIIVNFLTAGVVGEFATYRKDSFASKLKDSVAVMYSWDRALLEGDTEESRKWREIVDSNWGVSPRKALQDVGVAIRGLDPDFWVRAMFAKHSVRNPDIAITDARFPNEFGAIHARGGVLIRVVRGPDPEWVAMIKNAGILSTDSVEYVNEYLMSTGFFNSSEDLPHESEWRGACEDVDYDIVLRNEGTLKELAHVVQHLVNIEFDMDNFGDYEEPDGTKVLNKREDDETD